MIYLEGLSRALHGMRLRRDSGQALVETAVSLSFLIVLLLGAVELGRVAYASIEVSNAARAATQYACMNGGIFQLSSTNGLSPDAAGMLNAAKADALEVSGISANSLTLTPAPTMSAVCSDGTGLTSKPTAGGCGKLFMFITVTAYTQATFDPLIHLPGFTTITLHGQSVQQVLP